MKDVMIFLGSGVSIPSKVPCVDQITQSLFNETWSKYSGGWYYKGVDPSPELRQFNNTNRQIKFLKILEQHADKYFQDRLDHKVNYEDLYYISRQLYEEDFHEIHNPAISDFYELIKQESAGLWKIRPDSYGDGFKFRELANESCQLIQDVVIVEISGHKTPKGLELIAEIAKDAQFDNVDIFTINHDELVEEQLKSNEIEYVDGFGSQVGDVRPYSPSKYDSRAKVQLFKLHGSVNWYRFRDELKDEFDFIAIPMIKDVERCKNDSGKYLDTLDHRAQILTGTYNKISDYGYGIFADMHWFFHDRLRKHDRIIMSGYGWNDRGINGMLMEWIYTSMNKRLILLHEKPELIRDKSMSGMPLRYETFVQEGRLKPVKKWLCNITLQELQPFIA